MVQELRGPDSVAGAAVYGRYSWILKTFLPLLSTVGPTHLAEHIIYTGDTRSVKVCPRHLSLVHQEAADWELCDKLKMGIIEPSESSWSSAVEWLLAGAIVPRFQNKDGLLHKQGTVAAQSPVLWPVQCPSHH